MSIFKISALGKNRMSKNVLFLRFWVFGGDTLVLNWPLIGP